MDEKAIEQIAEKVVSALNIEARFVYAAIEEGTCRGIVEVAGSHGASHAQNLLFSAIESGVSAAMWRMITQSTQMPCHDFFDTIEKAVREGIENVQRKDGR